MYEELTDADDCAYCGEHITPGFPAYGPYRDICAECWF